MRPKIGIVLGSAVGPEQLAAGASLAEDYGLDQIWLSEDYFFTGGISGATQALAVTDRIDVGVGVVSAITRHPALLAMELATVARQFPGRFYPGIGLGVPSWLRQMGLMPSSPLSAMQACLTSVKKLLAGREVSGSQGPFHFDSVSLTYPPDYRLPLAMGVSGPRMLRLSGEIADATILSVGASADYVAWAREQVDRGRECAGRDDRHEITVFALCSVDSDDPLRAKRAVREQLAFYRSAGGTNALTDVYGISDQVREMSSRGSVELFIDEMPEQWVEDMAIAGTPTECAAKISALHRAGADTIGLFPAPATDALTMVQRIGREVAPLLPA